MQTYIYVHKNALHIENIHIHKLDKNKNFYRKIFNKINISDFLFKNYTSKVLNDINVCILVNILNIK